MSADLDIITARHEDVLKIPEAALRRKDKRHHVILEDGQERAVEPGATDGVHVIVSSGVKAGEVVLVAGEKKKPRGMFSFGRRR